METCQGAWVGRPARAWFLGAKNLWCSLLILSTDILWMTCIYNQTALSYPISTEPSYSKSSHCQSDRSGTLTHLQDICPSIVDTCSVFLRIVYVFWEVQLHTWTGRKRSCCNLTWSTSACRALLGAVSNSCKATRRKLSLLIVCRLGHPVVQTQISCSMIGAFGFWQQWSCSSAMWAA